LFKEFCMSVIAVTGASGQLGRLVIGHLLTSHPAANIVAVVRDPARVADLEARGVQVRVADYSQPQALAAAFQGVDKLLLISSSEVGQRVPQHRNVIQAAQAAGVGLLAYTSLLHADRSPLGLAADHRDTEALLRASGLPHVLLRNGWYTENYAASVPSALQYGAVLGSAGDGRISSAPRVDYAVAAATVLGLDDQAGRVYELAGDQSYTLSELAAEIARLSGRPVVYRNLPEAEYKAALVGAGLPEGLAAMLAQADVGVSLGGLFDDSRQLSRLVGRPTTPLAEVLKAALPA
jgi:NAD(P)H dehydrogenase (quinone)